MRVLLVHQSYPPEGGGAEVYTEALARRLAREHEVSVLYRTATAPTESAALRESARDGVRLLAWSGPRAGGFEAYRDPQVTAIAESVIERTCANVVHVGHLHGLSTGVVFAARRMGVPVVVTVHDFWAVCALGQLLNLERQVCAGPTPTRCLACVGEQVASASVSVRRWAPRLPGARALAAMGRAYSQATDAGAPRIARRLDETMEMLRAADVRLAPSRFLRDRLQALGAPPIDVLDLGHEPLVGYERRADADGRVRFGFLGGCTPSKGVHVLAEAFARLGSPRARLEIHGGFAPYHGDTGYEAEVRRALGPGAEASLAGPFARDALGGILSGLDVLVVPSLWEENRPLVVQEAFLARVPLIVSDHGGLAEMVRDEVDGLRFRPGDAAHLAAQMSRLVDDAALRGRLGRHPPHVPTMDEHAAAVLEMYAEARRRYTRRSGRVGVVVVDHGHAEETSRAVASARDVAIDPRVVVVENGAGAAPSLPVGVRFLRLEANRGYAGGINAGLRALREEDWDRVLFLNNDAVLEPGALRRLAEALDDDPRVAAVAPLVRRAADGRVESRGIRLNGRTGRVRLLGHGEIYAAREGRLEVESLAGAAWMVRRDALQDLGPLDESYFLYFEEVDWCLRARAAGWRLQTVLGAQARHVGSLTLGERSPERLYYATRNHLRVMAQHFPAAGWAGRLRSTSAVVFNLLYGPRRVGAGAGVRAVLQAARDYARGKTGPR